MRDLRSLSVEAIREHGAMQKPEEFAVLLALIRQADPASIWEVGCGEGGVLWALDKLLDTAKIYAINLPYGPYGGSGTDLAAVAGPGRIQVIEGDSRSVALPDIRPDVVLIDGDHSYRGVSADWDRYWPLVNKGGLLAFHDIVTHPSETGVEVHQLWAELCWQTDPRLDTVEIVTDEERAWGGIGVVFK